MINEEKVLDISVAIFIPLEEVWFMPTNQKSSEILIKYDRFYAERVSKLEWLSKIHEFSKDLLMQCRLYSFCDLGLRDIIYRDQVYADMDLPVLEVPSQAEYNRSVTTKYTPNGKESLVIDPERHKLNLPIFSDSYYKTVERIKLSNRFYRDLATCTLVKLFYDVLASCIGDGYTIRIRIADPEKNSYVGEYIESRKVGMGCMFYPSDNWFYDEIEELYHRFFVKEFFVLYDTELKIKEDYLEIKKVRKNE